PRVRAIIGELQAPLLRSLVAELDDLAEIREMIESTLLDDPPALARDGGFTRGGVDRELDELTAISRSGKQVIAAMEERGRACRRRPARWRRSTCSPPWPRARRLAITSSRTCTTATS